MTSTTLSLGRDAEAPARAVWEVLNDALATQIRQRVLVRWKCGHVNIESRSATEWFAHDVAYAVFRVLEGTGELAVDARGGLRDALGITADYDGSARRIRALAAAVRRREVYNVIRRAAALLEDLGEVDPAAVLAEYALDHEPAGDGVAFSRIRRRKSELRRTDVA